MSQSTSVSQVPSDFDKISFLLKKVNRFNLEIGTLCVRIKEELNAVITGDIIDFAKLKLSDEQTAEILQQLDQLFGWTTKEKKCITHIVKCGSTLASDVLRNKHKAHNVYFNTSNPQYGLRKAILELSTKKAREEELAESEKRQSTDNGSIATSKKRQSTDSNGSIATSKKRPSTHSNGSIATSKKRYRKVSSGKPKSPEYADPSDLTNDPDPVYISDSEEFESEYESDPKKIKSDSERKVNSVSVPETGTNSTSSNETVASTNEISDQRSESNDNSLNKSESRDSDNELANNTSTLNINESDSEESAGKKGLVIIKTEPEEAATVTRSMARERELESAREREQEESDLACVKYKGEEIWIDCLSDLSDEEN